MKVKLTVYKGFLVIETLKKEKDADFRPIEPGYVGCHLKNTGKHLGVSKEALMFMKGLQASGDDIGETNAYVTTDGIHCFSWLGPPCRLVNTDAELSSTDLGDIDFIEVPNITHGKAKTAILGIYEQLEENHPPHNATASRDKKT